MFNRSSRVDFRGKGFGWVSDNPDLRDYKLDDSFLIELNPTQEQQSLRIATKIIKALTEEKEAVTEEKEALTDLVEYLEYQTVNYSIASIRHYDILKPYNSHSKIKEVKYHLYYFLKVIKEDEIKEIINILDGPNDRNRRNPNSDDSDNDEKNLDYKIIAFQKALRYLNEIAESNTVKLRNKKEPIFDLNHKNEVLWLRSEYYDMNLSALVIIFQAFVVSKQRQKNNEQIEIDGIIGTNTYKALEVWLNKGSKELEDYRKAESISFPGPIQTEVLSLILTSLISDDTYELLRKRFSEKFNDEIIEPTNNTSNHHSFKEEFMNDLHYRAQHDEYIDFQFYKLVDYISKEYYLYIEPLVIIVLHFLGVIGAYKHLDYAIKLAISQLKFILKLDLDVLNQIISDVTFTTDNNVQSFSEQDSEKPSKTSEQSISSHDYSSLRLEKLERIIKIIELKFLGSTEKLPDEFRLMMLEEIENLKWLKQTSYLAIYQFLNRLLTRLPNNDSEEFLDDDLEKGFGRESQTKRIEDFKILLLGNMTDETDSKTTGLVPEIINMCWPTISDKTSNGENQITAKSQLREKLSAKILPDMKKFLQGCRSNNDDLCLSNQENFFDLIEDKPNIIEFIRDDILSNDLKKINIEKIIEENLKKQFGYKNKFNKSVSIFEFSSLYHIPIGERLIHSYLHRINAQVSANSSPDSDNTIDDFPTYFAQLPNAVDLTYWCSPVTDQGPINTCTAHAGVAMLEYFARRHANDSESLSIPFLYNVTRSMAKRTGNVGLSPRETMQTMVSVGIPPTRFSSEGVSDFGADPSNLMYSVAQNYQALNYVRFDHPNVPKDDLLTRIKIMLAAGFPCMFGFTVYQSIYEDFNIRRGFIPYPKNSTRNFRQLDMKVEESDAVGGHAVVAFGYHNYKRIPISGGKGYSQGAILIRNSWGEEWGIGGYGWLPYEYILKGLTSDWWSLINAEWLKTGRFGLGGSGDFGGRPTKYS